MENYSDKDFLGSDMTMTNMERLMSRLVRLKSLELHGRGGEDLVNAKAVE